jgi:Methyltransferase FkbM domain
LSSQQDAVKSAKELNNGEVFSADVMGISLSSMVRNTALAFKEGVTDVDKQGGLLIIKMDVEGAEYQVLKEVAESGVLCEYAKMGNRVVFVVEYHNMSITDPKERKREKDGHQAAVKKMEECGIEFQKLQAFWA